MAVSSALDKAIQAKMEQTQSKQMLLTVTELSDIITTLQVQTKDLQKQLNDMQNNINGVASSLPSVTEQMQTLSDQAKDLQESIKKLHTVTCNTTTQMEQIPNHLTETAKAQIEQATALIINPISNQISNNLQNIITKEVQEQIGLMIQDTLSQPVSQVNESMLFTFHQMRDLQLGMEKRLKNLQAAIQIPKTIFYSLIVCSIPIIAMQLLSMIIPVTTSYWGAVLALMTIMGFCIGMAFYIAHKQGLIQALKE